MCFTYLHDRLGAGGYGYKTACKQSPKSIKDLKLTPGRAHPRPAFEFLGAPFSARTAPRKCHLRFLVPLENNLSRINA